jgi:hypothetical protein
VTPGLKGRIFALLFLAQAVVCATTQAAIEDRINEAMPLPKAAVFARTALLRLADDAGVLPQVQSEVAAKLRVRAIDCAQGYAPGPLASRQEIAAHFGATDCFERRDDELVRWMGWMRVGILLRMPPLRPIPATVPQFLAGSDYIQQVKFAANAGVALLWTNRSIEVLDLGSGKRIARIEGAGGDLLGDLSPNGRILPLSAPGGTSLIDIETGESLARVDAISPTDFAWLGPDRALIHRRSMISSYTVDFDSGSESPINVSKEPIDRVVASSTAPGEFLALTDLSAMRLKVGAGVGEARLTLLDLKPFKIQNWMRNAGVLNSDGRYYVIAAQDLNFLATRSLTINTVAVAPFEVRIVVPLPDPDLILLNGDNPGINPNTGWRQYVYSLSRQTFAPLDRTDMKDGRIVYLPTVHKIGIITQNRIALLDSLPVGPVISHGDFVSTMNLEQQQHREAMTQQARGPQVRGVGPVQVQTLPGARITMQTSGSSWTVTSQAVAADIEGIGIQQSGNALSKPDGTREGLVVVHVMRGSGTPIALVMSSHEPVRWMLSIEHGAVITSIMTAGPKASEVQGAGSIAITHVSDADASQTNSPEFERLQTDVTRAAGSRINHFQGAAVGGEFVVGGQAP